MQFRDHRTHKFTLLRKTGVYRDDHDFPIFNPNLKALVHDLLPRLEQLPIIFVVGEIFDKKMTIFTIDLTVVKFSLLT